MSILKVFHIINVQNSLENFPVKELGVKIQPVIKQLLGNGQPGASSAINYNLGTFNIIRVQNSPENLHSSPFLSKSLASKGGKATVAWQQTI